MNAGRQRDVDKDREAWEALDPVTQRVLSGFNRRYHRFARVVIVLLVVLGAASLVGGGLTVLLLKQNADQEAALVSQAYAAIQQNVTARYDDCRAGDEVRQALYDQARTSARLTRLLLRLVPSLDTPEVRRLAARRRAHQLKVYRPRGDAGCAGYALRVVPPGERAEYRVLP